VPRVGLIVNDGKDLAISTADLIENRLKAAGLEVARVSSSGPAPALQGLCRLRPRQFR
jgi:NAD+ kinase